MHVYTDLIYINVQVNSYVMYMLSPAADTQCFSNISLLVRVTEYFTYAQCSLKDVNILVAQPCCLVDSIWLLTHYEFVRFFNVLILSSWYIILF